MMDVIQEVKNRQTKEGLSNRQFAKKLGISRQQWDGLVKGTREASWKVFGAIIGTYPDLIDSVLDSVDAKVFHMGKLKDEKSITNKK